MSVYVLTEHIGHVLTAHAAAISPTSWSIGGRFRFDERPDLNTGYGLITKGTYDGDIVYLLRYYNDAGTLKLQAGIRSGGTVYVASLTLTVELGRWYEIAATLATGGTCYVYAVPTEERLEQSRPTAYTLTASASIATAVPTSTASLFVGASTGGGGVVGGMTGSFCNIFVYNAQLTQATLEGRIGKRLVGTESNLVLSHYCDEHLTAGGGTTVYDRASGTGRNGTFTNSPTWADDPAGLWYEIGDTSGLPLLGAVSWTRGRRTAITASDEVAAYLASNLRSPRQAVFTRTANATGAKTWTFDFGRPVPFQLLSIRNHNWSSGAVVTIALNSADSWGAPAVTETVTFHPSEVTKVLARRYCFRYARLSVTDANATGGYIQLGTCDFWLTWESTVPVSMDDESQLNDPSVAVETIHGDRVSRSLTPSTDGTWSFNDMRRDEALELERLLEEGGSGAAVLFCADPRRALPAALYGYPVGLPEHSLMGPAGQHRNLRGLSLLRDRP